MQTSFYNLIEYLIKHPGNLKDPKLVRNKGHKKLGGLFLTYLVNLNPH